MNFLFDAHVIFVTVVMREAWQSVFKLKSVRLLTLASTGPGSNSPWLHATTLGRFQSSRLLSVFPGAFLHTSRNRLFSGANFTFPD